jgi:NADH:ubiquinone oxidoreductase subunit 3 (subunit A)
MNAGRAGYNHDPEGHTGGRAAMLTIVFLGLLVMLAIAGIAIAVFAGTRRRKGQHRAPFEGGDTAGNTPKTGRASGIN